MVYNCILQTFTSDAGPGGGGEVEGYRLSEVVIFVIFSVCSNMCEASTFKIGQPSLLSNPPENFTIEFEVM